MSKMTKEQAIKIFKEYELINMKISVTDQYPNEGVFRTWEPGDCWYLFLRSKSDLPRIGASRIVGISKSTGKILFDGFFGE